MQASSQRALVNMFPGWLPGDILPIGERDIERIETDQQLMRAPEPSKDVHNTGFHASIPHEFFMGNSIRVEGIDAALNWKVFLDPRVGIGKIELGVEGFQPRERSLLVLDGFFIWNSVLDHYIAIREEIIAEVIVLLCWSVMVSDSCTTKVEREMTNVAKSGIGSGISAAGAMTIRENRGFRSRTDIFVICVRQSEVCRVYTKCVADRLAGLILVCHKRSGIHRANFLTAKREGTRSMISDQ